MVRRVYTVTMALLILAGVTAAAMNDQAKAQELSALERLQQENLDLKQQLVAFIYRAETCEGKLAPFNLQQDAKALETEQAALKERFEAGRPGYTWDGKAFTKKPTP